MRQSDSQAGSRQQATHARLSLAASCLLLATCYLLLAACYLLLAACHLLLPTVLATCYLLLGVMLDAHALEGVDTRLALLRCKYEVSE